LGNFFGGSPKTIRILLVLNVVLLEEEEDGVKEDTDNIPQLNRNIHIVLVFG